MDEKKRLIKAYEEVTGRSPMNLGDMLNILAHPSVIEHAKAYLQVVDHTDSCKKYQSPWNCAMETKAYAQTIGNGWAGEMHHVMENWCINCRARMFGEDPGDATPMGQEWLEDTEQERDNPFLVDCD